MARRIGSQPLHAQTNWKHFFTCNLNDLHTVWYASSQQQITIISRSRKILLICLVTKTTGSWDVSMRWQSLPWYDHANPIPLSCDINSVLLQLINLFTTIHDGNFRRHSSMNVTIIWQKFSSNILHLCIFRHLKLEIALAIPASNDEK